MSTPWYMPGGLESSWEEDTIYCEAAIPPEDVLYKSTNKQDCGNVSARRLRCELAGQRFLDGKLPYLLSATLRGPFDKASGWINPWESKPRRKSAAVDKPTTLTSVKNDYPEDDLLENSISERVGESNGSDCHLPSPASLKQTSPTDSHPYLEDDELAYVKNWRDAILPLQAPESGIFASISRSARKRARDGESWLKREPNKRIKTEPTETSSLAAATPSGSRNASKNVGIGSLEADSSPFPDISFRSTPEGLVAKKQAPRQPSTRTFVKVEEDELTDAPNVSFSSAPSRLPSSVKRTSPRQGRKQTVKQELIDSEDELSRERAAATLSSPVSLKQASVHSQTPSRKSPLRKGETPRRSPRLLKNLDQVVEVGDISMEDVQLTCHDNMLETQQDESFCYKSKMQQTVPRKSPSDIENTSTRSKSTSVSSDGSWSGLSQEISRASALDVNPSAMQLDESDNDDTSHGNETVDESAISAGGVNGDTSTSSKVFHHHEPETQDFYRFNDTQEPGLPQVDTSEDGESSIDTSSDECSATPRALPSEAREGSINIDTAPTGQRTKSDSGPSTYSATSRHSGDEFQDTMVHMTPIRSSSGPEAGEAAPTSNHSSVESVVVREAGDLSSKSTFSPLETHVGCDNGRIYSPPATMNSETNDIHISSPVQEQSPWVKTQVSQRVSFGTKGNGNRSPSPRGSDEPSSQVPPELQSPWVSNVDVITRLKDHTSESTRTGRVSSVLPEPTTPRGENTNSQSGCASVPARPSTPEPQFSVKSFASFMTPSPERRARRARQNARVKPGSQLSSTQGILASAMKNPWTDSKPSRRVSWALLPQEDGQDNAPTSYDYERWKEDNLACRGRPASPPPAAPLAEIEVPSNSRFGKYFAAVARRTSDLGRFIPSMSRSSQSDLQGEEHENSPSPSDNLIHSGTKDEGSAIHDVIGLGEDDDAEDSDMEKPGDIMEDLFRDIGDMLQTWDVDAELDEARKTQGSQAEKTMGSQRAFV